MDHWLTQELEDYLGPANREEGVLSTAVPGLSIFQTRSTTISCHTVYKPVVCAVVQGAKRVELGDSAEECDEGKILSIGFDAVLKSSIVRGSLERPYRAVSVELDFGLLEEIAKSVPGLSLPEKAPVNGWFVDERREGLSDALRRLFLLVHTPRMIPVLAPGIQREIAWHLLSGPRGADVLRFSFSRSHTRLLSNAVREIQRDVSHPLRIPELAASAGMSPSSFHQRFKELTAYSPVQFQKRLRLLEARRMMLAEDAAAADAAYRVGYQSPSQFSREYSRLFGVPPHRDKVAARSIRVGPQGVI